MENYKRRAAEKRKLTDRLIRTIEPGADTHWVYDSEVPYLGLRTMPSGVKSFTYGYRNHEGRLHRVTLGRFPALTATAARKRAREIAAKVAVGKDPFEEKHEERAKLTTGKLVDLFVKGGKFDSKRYESHLKTKKSAYDWEAYLRRDFLPYIGAHTKAEDVKRRDIVAMLDGKAATAPVAANRLLEVVRRLYTWGMDKELVEATPFARKVKRPTEEKSRDRVLSEDEIRALWNSLPEARHMTESTRTALRLVLLTAQRPGEVCGMEWDELDVARGWWEIPREKTKSDRAHRVPLTPMALELIEAQPKGDRWIFSIKPVGLHSGVRRNKFLGLKRWTPHDLRRTAASHMAAAGVDRFTLERVLNHADSSVTGIYDRYTYDAEKRRALEKWERRLRSIIGESVDSNVVEIAR